MAVAVPSPYVTPTFMYLTGQMLMEDEGWTWQSIKTRWRYYLPLTMWLPTYSWRNDFPKDLIAGIAVATMLIPQALSYATLARLPPEFGLYTAWVSSAAFLCHVSNSLRHLCSFTSSWAPPDSSLSGPTRSAVSSYVIHSACGPPH